MPARFLASDKQGKLAGKVYQYSPRRVEIFCVAQFTSGEFLEKGKKMKV